MKNKNLFYKITGFYYEFEWERYIGILFFTSYFFDNRNHPGKIIQDFGYFTAVLALGVVIHFVIFPLYFEKIKSEKVKKKLRFVTLNIAIFNFTFGSIWMVNFLVIEKTPLTADVMEKISGVLIFSFLTILHPIALLYTEKLRNVYLRVLFFILPVSIFLFLIYKEFFFNG